MALVLVTMVGTTTASATVAAWWFSCAHDSAIQCKRKTQATNVQPRKKKIMRHVPDATDCAVVASSLYELRSRETKTQLRSPARIKNSILSFCCSCRNLGAYLVSPQHTPQYYPVHTLPSQSHSDAAGCSSVSVSVSVLLDDKINDGNANANYTILIIVFS